MGRGGERVRRRVLATGIALVALGCATAYGFLVSRNQLFPYRPASQLWRRVFPWSRQFHLARRGTGPKGLSLDAINRLAQIPYLRGYRPARGQVSVRVYDPALVLDGLNLFVSGHAPEVTLMDMDGRVLKTWKADAHEAFPGIVPLKDRREGARFFRSARLLPDGGVVAMFEDLGLVNLDPESRIRWSWFGHAHHDLFVDAAGSVWALTYAKRFLSDLRPADEVNDNLVVQLSPNGRLVRRISILESFQNSLYAAVFARFRRTSDVFHANSLEVFDGTLAARSPLFRKGNVLLSLRSLDLLAILNPDEKRIVWALTGQWHRQHWAHLLPTGHLMLFDNLGTMRAASRVLELDPFTQEILWRFGGEPGEELLSETSGFAHRLSNGNTIVGESNFGRAIEVTPDRRVAWEFINPNRAGKKNELIANLFDLQRLPRDLPCWRGLAGEQSPVARRVHP